MKTFRIIIATSVATIGIGVGVILGILTNDGNLTFEKRETEHTIETYYDGELQSTEKIKEFDGWDIGIYFVDSATIGSNK